ncbi:MAG: rhodanese-like domain-containing protein, partial [Candidatus Thorarchaeota archaeon]
IGYLKDGFPGWKNGGKQTESISTISSENLNNALKKGTVSIIDVRESHEYEKEWISDSRSSPLTRLEEEVTFIDATEKIVTVCPSGFRSTTAASIMKRRGFDDIAVFLEGLKKWKADGYSMEQ